jgi:GDPmannose 4,6-dehydratase
MLGKRALITGITGQDGSYLAEFLLGKGYEVHGIKRRSSLINTQRIDGIYQDPHEQGRRLILHFGDMADSSNLMGLVQKIRPHEIYNLAAQSHVAVSFQQAEYTADINALGPLRLLEAVRLLGMEKVTRFYQAGTSEMFGLVRETPQTELTPFHPRSPYGVAKVFAHWMVVNYREAHGMYACNGILFNHESPRRGETFVTRKITRGLARLALGLEDQLYLGNLDALRDWGHARDYVEAQWLMLQQPSPADYVIASGIQCSVRDFVKIAAAQLGVGIEFHGRGLAEVGVVSSLDGDKAPGLKVGSRIVSVDPRYFRPAEVDSLLGDASQAGVKLGWKPKSTLVDICREMMMADFADARRVSVLREHGLDGAFC